MKRASEARRADREAPLPDFLPPTLATLVDKPPKGDAWLHEIKFDGYRILARLEDGSVRLLSRNRKDWTKQFSRVATAIAKLPARRALLDGEVVFPLADGTTSFQEVQNALSRESQKGLAFVAFDLLHLDGEDLTGLVLEERKRLLAALVDKADSAGVVRYSDHVVGQGAEFYEQACRHSLEGIVSKRRDVAWRPGRSRDWCKVKCLQGQEFVIGGFTEGSGSRTGFGSLLIGVHEDGRLRYCGRVGTGFSEATLRTLKKRLLALERGSMPFASLPDEARRGVVLHWVEPELVAEVSFLGWTRDGHVRHPSFRGLREDRSPKEVTVDKPAPAPAAEPEAPAGARAPRVAGVRIGNASKVLYPDIGLTKLEIARYYEMVAPWMLAHAAERPLTLVRCPNGFDSDCFFQKSAAGAPEETLGRVRIPDRKGGEDSHYLYFRDAAGLVTLLQMGVLEIHVWGSKVSDIERADRLVFDLDPGPGVSWKAVIEGAHTVRATLAQLGLESVVMTTGGKGLHVTVPILPELEWPVVKSFTRAVVQAVVRLEPGRYTVHLAKARRENVIFIDYLRNGREATAVAPYSTRARPNAPVAVPLAWEELSTDLRPDQFTVRNLAERMKGRKKDPWQEARLRPQSIAKIVDSARTKR